MTVHDGLANLPADSIDPVAALAGACQHFATHVQLLADQLSQVPPQPQRRSDHRRCRAACLRRRRAQRGGVVVMPGAWRIAPRTAAGRASASTRRATCS
ncbi:hypothetical protein ACOZ38_28175 [Sphaerisporangium viridialbum]|uniref:hypothetical protein n=1 Tax=Sphaerisporangium viridialbum TaxID=46189 RepID=UPI003C70DF34